MSWHSSRDLSFNQSIRNIFSENSVLDQGIECIESVLEPGSASAMALTPEQRKGLMQLKLTLCEGVHEESFVPIALLKRSEKTHSPQDAFLLQHFGGVASKSWTKNLLLRTVNKVKNANMFLKGIQLKEEESPKVVVDVASASCSVPEEWNELTLETQHRLREMLSWESLSKWDFPILDIAKLTNGHPLLFVGWAILCSPHSQRLMDLACGTNTVKPKGKRGGYKFIETFNMEIEEVAGFLRLIERHYKDVPYHNRTHAADITQSLHALLQMNGKDFASQPLELLSILLSAIVHDVSHPGLNNAFQVNAKSELALFYNDISVLENMHVAKTFQLLMGEGADPSVNILSGLTKDEILIVRKQMIDSVLHTDMTKHFQSVSHIKGLLNLSSNPAKLSRDHKRDILTFLLHLADISNPAKPSPYFEHWTDAVLEESFAQGAKEKSLGLPVSPQCDRSIVKRSESQIGFIEFVVMPAWEVVGKFLPRAQKEILPILQQNLEFWEEQAKRQAKEEVNKTGNS